MSKPAPDYGKEPWKHPAVWSKHIVCNVLGDFAGETFAVATCECGWKLRWKLSENKAREAATLDHWRDVIKASEVPA